MPDPLRTISLGDPGDAEPLTSRQCAARQIANRDTLPDSAVPDHLKTSELPSGNALIEGATFLAILIGTTAGTKAAVEISNPWLVSVALVLVAVACWGAAMFIPRTGSRAEGLRINPNVLASTWDLIAAIRADRRVWPATLIANWFWAFGAVVLSLMPTLVRQRLGGDENLYIVFLTVFSVSIAIGSGLAAWLAHGRILLLPTPVAGVLMSVFAIDVGIATWSASAQATVSPLAFLATLHGARIVLDLFGMAVAGGLFIVPAFSAIQSWAGEDRRARVVAANNVVSAAYIVVAALVAGGLQAAGFSEGQVFVVLGVIGIAVALVAFRVLSFDPMADLLSIIFRTLYRMEVKGVENVARAGPNAILSPNHTSFLDAALVMSLSGNQPVFAIDSGIAKLWWVKPFLHLVRAIPLDPTKPMATRTLIQAVQKGQSLVIFPEGRLTVTGSLMKVYDGAGLIADKSGAMVVPIRIEGLEQTPFSRLTAEQTRRRWWPKVTVTILEPVRLALPTDLVGRKRRHAAGTALYQIMSDLIFRTTPTDRTVLRAIMDAAAKHGLSRIAVEDPVSGALSYKRLLVGAAVLGRKFMALPASNSVGLMMPSSDAAAVAILGLMSAGRTPAMINFTAGAANILSACRAAEVHTLITSRAFVEKGRLGPLVDAIAGRVSIAYLEDMRAEVGLVDKLRGLLGWRRPLVESLPSSPAVVLFTSGSEGAPKGVVLSHQNILANAAQAAARIDFGRTDTVFNVLPVFHSFGLTVGLVLPLVFGVRTFQYPSPLHYRIVPELVYGTNATIMFGTDTFLAGYARAANPYDLRSLRYVLAGAEPVKEATRQIYLEKFGLRILEGYGVTETAPALALNTPMYNRFGTVGRILPGMETRLDPVPGVEEGGRLYVRGPNVMMGYVRADNPGVLEPPPEGWHDTGDIVTIDADGFIVIRGRAKRFAKIGGEMVSLAAVEALAAELWPDSGSAVVTVPDPRKSERMVLVTQKTGATRAALQAFARSKGASEMMAPSEVIVVDRLPLLGSGKVDYAGVTTLLRDRVAA